MLIWFWPYGAARLRGIDVGESWRDAARNDIQNRKTYDLTFILVCDYKYNGSKPDIHRDFVVKNEDALSQMN